MRTFLLLVGGFLVLVLATLFAGPLLIDWNSYRTSFEKEAATVLGRPVRIGGDVEVRLLPAPRLYLENVRIADSTGRFDRPLFRVQRFTLWLAVAPLLSGILEAKSISLDEPELRLAVGPDGRGNWLGLGGGLADLPYLPKEVTLSSVDLKGGTLSLFGSDGQELVRIERVEGELGAPALAGPYRFKGLASHGGVEREVRLSTGVAGEEGLRIKATVTAPQDGSSYGLDGTLTGLEGKLALSGGLDARIRYAFPGVGEATTEDQLVEVKSQVEADLAGGRLSGIAATFQSDGRPQILSGSASAVWGKEVRYETDLSAHWLDLDRIAQVGAAADGAAGPWTAIGRLAGWLGQAYSKDAQARLKTRIEQATLGGETVSNLTLDLEHTPSALVLRSISGELPGAAVLRASGLVTADGGGPAFQGPVEVHGRNVARFAHWVLPALGGSIEAAADAGGGAFVLDGELQLDPGAITAERTRLQIAGTNVTGNLKIGLGKDRSVAIGLESDRLDLTGIMALPPTLADALAMLKPLLAGETVPEGSPLALLSPESRIEIRLGELITSAAHLQDVTARLKRNGRELALERLELSSEEGLSLKADGQVTLGEQPAGLFGLLLEARNRDAARDLGAFLGLSPAFAGDPRFMGLAGGLRVAGLMSLGQRGPRGFDLSADGEVASGRLALSLRSDGSGEDLGHSRIELFAQIASPDGAALADTLVGPRAPVAAADSAAFATASVEPGEVSLRASGVPAKGLSAVLGLRTKPVAASFEGVATVENGGLALEGSLRATAEEGARLLAIAGLDRLFDAEGDSARLAGVVRREPGRVELADMIVALGARSLQGGVEITERDGRTYVAVDARTNRLEMASLLGSLVAHAPPSSLLPVANVAASSTVDAGAPAAAVPWSDQPFNFAALDGIDARLSLEAKSIGLLPGFSLGQARLNAEASDGRVRLTELEGQALGGKVRIEGTLAQEAAGASLTLKAEGSGLLLERVADRETSLARAKGSARFAVTASGKGLSPRGLVTVLAGSGELGLEGVELSGIAPATIDAVAAEVLKDKAPRYDEKDIADLVAQKRFLGRFAVAGTTAPLTIADGTLRIADLQADSEHAKLAIRTALDLQTIALDSEWVLEPKAAGTGAVLPGLSLVYAGPAAEAAALAPRVSAETLARELLARRIIGGLEQLEGLRPIEGLVEDRGFAVPAPQDASPDQSSEALDIPEPAVIAIPEPTAPQAISRATPSVGSFTQGDGQPGVVTRRLERSGKQKNVRREITSSKR